MIENKDIIHQYRKYQYGLIYKCAAHTEKKLSDIEARQLLKTYNALFVRNVYDWDCKEETSFWYVIQDAPIGIESLHSKCRNQVRRSYKTLLFNMLDVNRGGVIDDLYEVYISSFARYKIQTSAPMEKDEFTLHVTGVSKVADFWGAFDKETEKLIAYAEVVIQGNAAKYSALKAIPEDMTGTYPFYGLLFEMNRYYIEEKGFLYVTDGARSITEHSNIQSFLEKFNFRRAYCHFKITYVWWLGLIVKMLYPLRSIIKNQKFDILKCLC